MSGRQCILTRCSSTWRKKKCLSKDLFTDIDIRYWVEFSKPRQEKPIPEGTVKVFFYIIQDEETDNYTIEFQFENESLMHSLNKTMRTNMFQVSCFKAVTRYSNGSTECWRTSTKSSSSYIWAQNLNIQGSSTKRATASTHLSPSSTSQKSKTSRKS